MKKYLNRNVMLVAIAALAVIAAIAIRGSEPKTVDKEVTLDFEHFEP